MTTGCLFCRIVAGELPSRTVYEDADCVAFLDIAARAEVVALDRDAPHSVGKV